MFLSIFNALRCKKRRPHLRDRDGWSQQSHSGNADPGAMANAGLKGQVSMVGLTEYMVSAPRWEGEGQQPLPAQGIHHTVGGVS